MLQAAESVAIADTLLVDRRIGALTDRKMRVYRSVDRVRGKIPQCL
jgi:hypothetical protein